MQWVRAFARRLESLAAITRKSGILTACRLVRTYLGYLLQRVQTLLRPPIHLRSSTVQERETTFISLGPSTVFQPKAELVDQLARFDPKDTANLTRLSDEKIIYRDIPYSKYMGRWQFHPGRIGGELARLGLNDPRLERTATRLKDHFVRLPNGGLALYYPKTFSVTRLQCREYLYSAIAQGQLLAGYSRLAKIPHLSAEARATWRRMASDIARSLEFTFEDGGVSVEGKILLETPNFRSPPEIVLNGWIDALIHLHDHLEEDRQSQTLRQLFDTNIAALAQLLPQFDDEKQRLSKYSNLSPYRIRLRLAGPQVPIIRLNYRSNVAGFKSYRIEDLRVHDAAGPCFFENAIVRRTSQFIDVLISSSALYELELCVEGVISRAEIDSRPYGIWSGGQTSGGRRMIIEPQAPTPERNSQSILRIPSGLLMTGQSTDFAKGYNFYHTYHVVALLELCGMTREAAARRTIREFALKWLDYIERPAPAIAKSRLQFADPNRVLRQIANGRGKRKVPSFAELVAASAVDSQALVAR